MVANEWIAKLPEPNNQELHILNTYVPKEDLSAKYGVLFSTCLVITEVLTVVLLG